MHVLCGAELCGFFTSMLRGAELCTLPLSKDVRCGRCLPDRLMSVLGVRAGRGSL